MMGNKNERYRGEHAGAYDTEIDRILGRSSREAIFKYLLGSGNLGSVIEFGCGPGFFTRAIARRASHVTATDISNPMIDRAKNNLKGCKNVSFQRLNCEDTGLPSDIYDTVFTANVVQILEHPESAVHEAYRILKPGGKLILLFYALDGLSVFNRFKMTIRFMNKFRHIPFRHMMSLDETRAMAQDAGFNIDELKLIGSKMKAVYLQATKPAAK